jgi:hypothetical protein
MVDGIGRRSSSTTAPSTMMRSPIASFPSNSFNPVEVIKVFEGSKARPFASSLGPVWYRAEDHQLVRPVPVVGR